MVETILALILMGFILIQICISSPLFVLESKGSGCIRGMISGNGIITISSPLFSSNKK